MTAAAMMMTIDEVFNEAIMSSTPALLVEGINDIKIYMSLANLASKPCEIYPIETISGYSGGCGHVVNAIQELYTLNDPYHPVKNFVLGIVDRDTREFRNTLPTEDAILVLDRYSIESHFVGKEVLLYSIGMFMRVHPDGLTKEFLDELFSRIEIELLDLYYFSLEALQCAVDPTYVADFKYSYAGNRRNQALCRSAVLAKRPQLDQFAAQFGLTQDINSLMRISCGKWLLTAFCTSIEALFENFTQFCGQHGMAQCEFCRVTIPNKCTYSYRLKVPSPHNILYCLAPENVNIPALEYIRVRIGQISLTTVH